MQLDRRRFLIVGGTVLAVAACGANGGSKAELSIFRRFGDNVIAADGTPQRLLYSLGDDEGFLTSGAPETINVEIDGVLEPTTVEVRSDGVPIPHYAVVAAFPEPGLYDVRIRSAAGDGESQVMPVAAVTVPGPGASMPPIATPTFDDQGGVDPFCSRRSGPCPFHETTLADALGAGPIVLMVSTPQFCQTDICGPTLEMLIEEHPPFVGGVTAIHAEVYQQPTPEALGPVTETITTLEMSYEPAMFLIDGAGEITERLDFAFDRSEIVGALERLVAL